MDATSVAAGVCHAVSRKLLLWHLLWHKSCRGVSLITQELFLVVYVARYIDLLYLFESFGAEIVKIAHLAVAIAIVLIMRYYEPVLGTYDVELDTVPRAAMLIPPLVLAVVFHKARGPCMHACVCEAWRPCDTHVSMGPRGGGSTGAHNLVVCVRAPTDANTAFLPR